MSFSVPGGADATVRGRYELSADGALRTLTSIRDRGREADAALESLGRRMDTLAVKVARPRVELTGLERVNMQLAELEARLDRLDRRSVTSRVRLGGGFANNAGGGFGGGGQGLVAGGPGSPLFSSVGGLAGRLPWWMAAAPLAPQLLGGAGALVSSAGAGALGAGAVGLGGLAAGATGGLLTLAVAKPAISAMGDITKAQDNYTKAVERYGRASAQAATQATALNAAVAANPAAAGAARQLSGFQQSWQSATAAARANVYSGVSGTLANARRATPTLGLAATGATGAVAGAATSFSGFLAQPQEQAMIMRMTGAFARDVPIAERSLENLATTLGHLSIAALPFFHEANVWVEHWSAGLARSSADTPRVQRGMEGLVNSAREWAHLTGDTGRLLRDIFAPGQHAGDSMVASLDRTIVHWDQFIRNNPGAVRQFFSDGERAVSRIATTVANLVGDVWQLFRALDPIFSRAEQFISFASGLGGGSLLGGAGLLYGAYQGGRSALGGVGPSPGGALSMFVAGRPGIGRMGGGGQAMGAAPLLAAAGAGSGLRATNLEVARGRLASGAILLGGATEGPDAVLARRAAAAESGWLSSVRGLATANPAMARAADIFSTGGRAIAGAARGAAMFLAPLAAIQGIVSGVGASGGAPHQINTGLSSALSMLTLGIVPQGAFQHVFSGAFGAAGTGLTVRGDPTLAGGYNRLAAQAGGVRTPAQLHQVLGGVSQGLARPGALSEMAPSEAAHVTAFLNRIAGTAVANAGASASNTWESAFTRGLDRGLGPQRAVAQMLGGVQSQIRQLGPRGARAFGQDTAQWANQMMLDDPRLRTPLRRLMDGIVSDINRMQGTVGASFHDLQRKVFYFNGQILTGSTQTWGAIHDALVNPAQRAQEKLSGIFGEIQAEAINALTGMGYSRQAAGQIVRNLGASSSAKNQAGDIARNTLNLAQGQNVQGSVLTTQGQTLTLPGAAGRTHARGGMLGGHGGLDTVELPNGDRAAPGEAYIANRHTMNDLTRATLNMYGKTAWQMIRDERRQHAYQTGGGLPPIIQADSVAGHPELKPGISRAVASVLGMFPGLSITSTTRGGHAGGSYHYLGEAADVAADPGTMFRAAQWIGSSGLARQLTEGIHNPNLSVKYGQGVPSSYWGASTWAQHLNHIHMAVGGGLNAGVLTGGALGGGGAAGFMASPLRLTAPNVGMGGIPGALAQRAANIYAAGLQGAVNSRTGATGISAAGFTGGGNATANQQLGLRMMLAAGWGADQWPALRSLWNQESGWSATAVNSSSGAAGIPQALGHGNVFRLGDAPGQIAWGLNYIRGKYGSPAAAWAHEQSHNWYQTGGRVNWAGWNAKGGRFSVSSPTLFGAGERGQRENVSITPAGKGGHGVIVNFHGVTFVGGDKRGLESIAEQVANKIIDALDGTEGGASARDLMGAQS